MLALFIPLVISSGGNSGSQASTLVVRAIALGEVRTRLWARVLLREMGAVAVLGLILGTLGFFRVVMFGSGNYGDPSVLLGLTLSVSLVFVVLWGTVTGSMLPLILKRVGLDPASASAPFVATLVDVSGLIIYFTAANFFLGGKLL